jgi:hypothetical protein
MHTIPIKTISIWSTSVCQVAVVEIEKAEQYVATLNSQEIVDSFFYSMLEEMTLKVMRLKIVSQRLKNCSKVLEISLSIVRLVCH